VGEFHVTEDVNVRVRTNRLRRISQGDIFSDIECIEYVAERRGVVEVSKIVYPLVVVLTQDCDLEEHSRYKTGEGTPSTHDKKLFSALVVPLYNAEHVYLGQHLSDLNLTMSQVPHKGMTGNSLKQNERPRYHYLSFPNNVPIVPSIADFKHYFSVNLAYLQKLRQKHFVCRLSELYREDLSQRFAAYLSRIGLPTILTANDAIRAPAISAARPQPAPPKS
jgi:hypothetical protein